MYSALFMIIKRCFLIVGATVLACVCAVPYFIGVAMYGRPPVVASLSSHMYMFYLCLFKMCPERNYFTYKVRLFLYFIQLTLLEPAIGVLWFVDDVLFPGYRDIKIERPVFIIGAYWYYSVCSNPC